MARAKAAGWGIEEIVRLTWNLEVDELAIMLAKDNNGRRDERIPLHSLVMEHLELVRRFRT